MNTEQTDEQFFFEEYNTKSLEQKLEDGEIIPEDYDTLRELKDRENGLE